MSKFSSDYWARFRDPEEKRVDRLVQAHGDGEHEDYKVDGCPDCEIQVEVE